MLQAFIAGGMIYGLFNLLERGKNRGLDGFTALTFVLVPALLIFLARLALGFIGTPPQFLLFLFSLYFIVPTLMLRLQYEFSWKNASGYGALVLVVAFLVDVILSLLFSAA